MPKAHNNSLVRAILRKSFGCPGRLNDGSEVAISDVHNAWPGDQTTGEYPGNKPKELYNTLISNYGKENVDKVLKDFKDGKLNEDDDMLEIMESNSQE